MKLLPAILVLFFAPAASPDDPPPVRVERVEEILAAARPKLEARTGLAWPEGLAVEATDPAGLTAVLREEFEAEVAALHPERPESSRRLLVDVLSRSFARIVRAKYGLATRRIHVSPGALDRLPEGVAPDDALVVIVVHEAVHAMDDAAVPLAEKVRTAAADPEALRALRMVIEGRAEHYGGLVCADLGVDPSVARSLAAMRDPGERLTRDAGAAFVAALAAKGPAAPLESLRNPPRTTTGIFHPGRDEPGPDDLPARLEEALPGATVSPLSELLLRRRFLDRVGTEPVERAFAGFVRGLQATTADGSRVSLVRAADEEGARRFLEGLLAFEGVPAGEQRRIPVPGGRSFHWIAGRQGSLVGEALSPEAPPAPMLARALESRTNR